RIGVSAYRRIGVSAYRRIGVSAYRRIGVSAYRRSRRSPPCGEDYNCPEMPITMHYSVRHED
ncbi:MAG: hypothetical protein LBD29_09650, partial [Treponema sp.]|nr:hypothetical protein [Treponema sp.]